MMEAGGHGMGEDIGRLPRREDSVLEDSGLEEEGEEAIWADMEEEAFLWGLDDINNNDYTENGDHLSDVELDDDENVEDTVFHPGIEWVEEEESVQFRSLEEEIVVEDTGWQSDGGEECAMLTAV